MISSLYQIDLTNPTGTYRLLDYGDMLGAELKFETEQSVSQYHPLHSPWAETNGEGSAVVSLQWERRQSHASHAASRSFCLRSAAGVAIRQTGTLTISVQGGESWQIADATVSSSAPAAMASGGFRTLTAYTAVGGSMNPASALTLYAGIPWNWTLQTWDSVADQWQTL